MSVSTALPTITTTYSNSSSAARAQLVLTFSEAVLAGTGTITISDGATQTYMGKDGTLRTRLIGATDTRTIDIKDTSKVTISGDTVTILLDSNLSSGNSYSVQMAKGVLQHADGNAYPGLADTSKLIFTATSTAVPSAVVDSSFTLSHDTGSSASDFITNAAAQTVAGKYSGTLAAGESIKVSLDNGGTWLDATVNAAEHTWSAIGTLTASSTVMARVINANGGFSQAARHAYVFDTDAPAVPSIEVKDADLVAGETTTVTVSFNEAVTGLDLADFTVTGGALSNLASSADGKTWTATLTPTAGIADQVGHITLKASGVADVAGNNGPASDSSQSFNYSTVPDAPTAAVATMSMTDSGSSSSDFITNVTAQTIKGTYTGTLAPTEYVEVSLDYGATWTQASAAGGMWSLDTTISTSHTLKARVSNGYSHSNPLVEAYTLDQAGPTATVTLSDSNLRKDETATITIKFSEAVTGLTSADLKSNDTISEPVSSDGGITWTATLTPTNNGNNSVTLYAASVTDLAGNSGPSADVAATYTADLILPTATISLADSILAAGETTLVTITFNEAVTGFTNADLTVENGTLSTVSSADGGVTWTATFTPTASVTDASNVITLDYAGVADAAGNAGSGAASSANYSVSTVRPTASIAVSDTALKAGETATVTFTFSEAVADFDAADVTVANGAISTPTSSDNITWTATLTPTASVDDTTNVITLDNTAITDSDGNTGTGTTSSGNYTVDTKLPTATVSLDNAALTSGQTSTVTITFSEAVTGLTSDDFTVTGGTLGTPSSVDNITWTAVLTPTANGAGQVQLNTSSVADSAGNSGPTAAASASFTYYAPPTATISTVAFSNDTGSSSSDLITSSASQTITGTLSDALGSGEKVQVSLDNGATWTDVTSTSGTGWILSGQTLGGSSTLLARVTNGETHNQSYSHTYTLDQAAPTATITLSEDELLTGETTTVTITFDEAVTGLTLSDLKYSGTMSGLASNAAGTIWTATLTPTSNGSGEVRLDASAVTDTAGNSGPSATAYASFTYNATPTATIATASITETGTGGDFITNSTSQVISGTVSETLGRGQYVEVSLDNGATWNQASMSGTSWVLSGQTISASNTLQVRVSNGTTTGTAYSHSYTLDQSAPSLSSISLSDSSLTTEETATVTVVFDEAVSGLANTDFSVSGGSLGTFTTTDNITWTATLTPTASGTVTLTASAVTDTAGNLGPAANSASQSFTFTSDTTGPSATLTLSDSTLGRDQTATLTVTFSEAVTDTPTAADFTVTGGSLGTFTTTDSGTTWTATLTPTANACGEGSVTLTANTINDPSGNPGPSSSASLPFNYDTQTLTLSSTIAFSSDTGDSGSDLVTNTGTQTISGSFTGGDIYTAMGDKIEVSTDNGETWSSATVDNTAHTWSISKTLSGSSTVKVKLTDASGDTPDTVSHSYTIDTTGPGSVASKIASLDSSSDSYNTDAGGTSHDNITNDDTPTITFSLASASLTAGDYVDVLDTSNSNAVLGTYTIESSALGEYGGSLSVTPSAALSEGTHTLVLRARDAAGNTGTQSSSALSITIDKTVASLAGETLDLAASSDTGTSSTDNITNDNTPTITVNVANTSTLAADDILQVIDTANGNAVVGTSRALTASDYGSSGGDISITLDTLSDGTHTLALRAVDKANNIGTASTSTLSVTVDTAAPTLSSASPADSATGTSVGTRTVTLTFNETVDTASSTSFEITNSATPSDSRTISFEALSNTGSSTGSIVTLNLASDLSYSSSYTVKYTGGTLTDVAGNSIDYETTFNTFSTESVAVPSAVSIALTESTYASHSGTDSDYVTKNNTLAVTGITASYLEYRTNSDSQWTPVTFSGTTASITLTDGDYSAGDIEVRQYDVSGHESTAATLAHDWTIDTTAPTAYASAPEGDFFGLGSLISIFSNITGAINGSLTVDDEFIEYTTDNGQNWSTAAETSSDSWLLSSLKIDSGGYVGLRVTDTAGNTGMRGDLDAYVVYVGDGYGGTAFTASGNMAVYTQGGNDLVTVSGSNNIVEGGYGNDTLTVGGSDNTVSGDSGSDIITVSGSDNDISAGDSEDTITITGSSNLVSAGDGGDTIDISAGDNTVYGESGADIITISATSGTVYGDDGGDTITLTGAYAAFEGTINGGDNSAYTDYLELETADQELNLNNIVSEIIHFERISLASNTQITIAAADAATMSDRDQLYVIGDSTDTIVLNSSEWTPATLLSLVGYSGYYNAANDITLIYSSGINIDTGTA
jgi:large repetitive protein